MAMITALQEDKICPNTKQRVAAPTELASKPYTSIKWSPYNRKAKIGKGHKQETSTAHETAFHTDEAPQFHSTAKDVDP